MRKCATLGRVALALCGTLLLVTTSAADPVKKKKVLDAAVTANAFPFVSGGVAVKIKTAAIAKDGTITARFTLTDAKGRGLDVNGLQTAGAMTVRFVAAYIPNGQTQYTAYTTTIDRSVTNDNPPQTQAGSDTGGTFTLVDSVTGTYDYTFGVKAPASFDATATHSVGMQAERDLSEFGMDTYAADDVFSWVPNGSAVTNVRDVVNEASCNRCHDPISAHGGGRKSMKYCVLCHTPQSVNPDTYNTADMKVFIHKLHMGSSLPSVKAGGKYFMVHRGAITDFSDIVFPQDIRNCTSCHAPGPKQADNWKTKPSREACGSCHETVNFATGENHLNLPQPDDSQCKSCHTQSGELEFDASITGAHVVPMKSSALPGIVLQVMKVESATPGQAPVVTFKVTDKAGNPVDIGKLTQIRVILAGPNVDYQAGAGGIRASEDPSKTAGSNGVYTYTMTNKLPAAAAGSYTVSLEARNTVTLMAGTKKEQTATDAALPVRMYFSVDQSEVVARRQVVATEKCAACHFDLTFNGGVHGGTRGATQECVMCHNPTLVDSTLKQSVSFATQIHAIHRGEALANPYMLGTTNYQEVRFPGDLRNCGTCHVNNSYQIESVGAVAPVQTPGHFIAPATAPVSAACLGCHDTKAAAAHALANTTAIGESCGACHGQSGDFAIDKVHARQ